MPNRSTRDERQNPDGTIQVSPPTQSAFGPASASDPPPPKAAAPTTPASGPGVSVFKAADTLRNRGRQIDQAVDDAS